MPRFVPVLVMSLSALVVLLLLATVAVRLERQWRHRRRARVVAAIARQIAAAAGGGFPREAILAALPHDPDTAFKVLLRVARDGDATTRDGIADIIDERRYGRGEIARLASVRHADA